MNKHNISIIAGRYIPAIISVIILTFIDQITKYYIAGHLEIYDSIPVIKDVFEIHYIRNSGAAWGLLQDRQILFYIITVFVLLLICVLYYKLSKTDSYKDIKILLILITSGAIGNFIDRVRFQYVIDFLYFKLINFPVFNVADCYVTVSFILLIILILFKYKESDFETISKL